MHAESSIPPQDLPRPRRTVEVVLLEQVDEAKAQLANATSGIEWPYPTLNDLTDTLIPGRLIIVGAYLGSGKTTFLINNQRMLARLGIPSLMFGTEQTAPDLRIKQACTELGISARDAMRKRIGSYWREELNKTLDAQAKGKFAGVHLANLPSPTPEQIEKSIRHYHKEKGVQVFFIDYLGRINTSSYRGEEWQRMKALVQMLKNLATTLGVVIIAANQVGKTEDRALSRHQKPEEARFMGGQAVCQEADVVLGIYQPLKPGTSMEDRRDVSLGVKELKDIVEPSTMAVCLLKHREDGLPLGAHAYFWIANNRMAPRRKEDLAPPTSMLNQEYAKNPNRHLPDPTIPF